MGDAERDESPTTPPKAVRQGPVSGMRAEPEPEPSIPVDVSTTELSITEPSARDPNTLMSLPKPEPSEAPPPHAAVRALEDRIDALEGRVRELETRRDPLGQARSTPWWFWFLFLFGLAATWRLLEALK
jgi:hypothetical protein